MESFEIPTFSAAEALDSPCLAADMDILICGRVMGIPDTTPPISSEVTCWLSGMVNWPKYFPHNSLLINARGRMAGATASAVESTEAIRLMHSPRDG